MNIEDIAGAYGPFVTGAVAFAALLATLLPPPVEGGHAAYRVFYWAVNLAAINRGHAVNATAPAPAKDRAP